ncbi:MAG: DUF1987 domain-containing protein [Sulfurimonadaceae bacterium]
MKTLIIEESKYTPAIELNAEKNRLTIKGKSYPENTFDFYAPVISWLQDYFSLEDLPKTTVNMDIIYFNSSSSKLFFDLFDLLEEAQDDGKEITVNWYYDEENESAEEAGEDFKEDFEDMDFNIIKK